MSKRILVVARDAAFCRILCDNFLFDGFEVLCLSDPAIAATEFGRFRPGLVVLEEALQTESGECFGTLLRERGSRVIVLSLDARARGPARPGRAETGDATESAWEVLATPFDLDELLDRARFLLGVPPRLPSVRPV